MKKGEGGGRVVGNQIRLKSKNKKLMMEEEELLMSGTSSENK